MLPHPQNNRLFGGESGRKLHALDTLALGTLPFPDGPWLQDDDPLLERGHGAEYLGAEWVRLTDVLRVAQLFAASVDSRVMVLA